MFIQTRPAGAPELRRIPVQPRRQEKGCPAVLRVSAEVPGPAEKQSFGRGP